MKLNEIKCLDENLRNNQKAWLALSDPTIEEYLEYIGVDSGSYTIKNDVVNVRTDLELAYQSLDGSGTFPVQWGEIDGDFKLKNYQLALQEFTGPTTVHGVFAVDYYNGKNLLNGPSETDRLYAILSCQKLQTLEGAPERTSGFSILEANSLKSLEHAPKYIKGDAIIDAGIPDLTGVGDIFNLIDGYMSLEWKKVTSGGLGLLSIRGLKGLHLLPSEWDMAVPFQIIDSYLRKSPNPEDRDIFACQQELIDADFEAFAVL